MDSTLVLQKVLDNLASWPLLLPEVLVSATIGVILVLGILLPRHTRYWLLPLAFVGTSLAWYSKYWLSSHVVLRPALPLFNQLLVLDPLAVCFCLLLLSITLFFLPLAASQTHWHLSPAYIALILGILLGSCLLVMAFHWLTIYLSLTLMSLSSVLLIGSHAMTHNAEACLKYLLYSMATTAVMLWGMAYFYGFTGTLSLSHPNLGVTLQAVPGYIVLGILLLCLSGIFLVLAATPYHFWLPDVYQGAPAIVVAYLSTVPKLATVAVLLRLFHQLLPQLSPILQEYSQYGMATLALLTITVGNAGALLQKDPHRLMAYGSMVQSGLLMAGIAVSSSSQVVVLYYSVVYGVMGLAAWVGIRLLQYLAGGMRFQDFMGLGRKFPALGSSIALVMLSLIGLPPTAGFTGKLVLFMSLWGHMQHTGHFLFVALLVASLLSTVLSLYYYLRLPYVLFCKTPRLTAATSGIHKGDRIILWCLTILLLAGFFAADRLLEVAGNWLGVN